MDFRIFQLSQKSENQYLESHLPSGKLPKGPKGAEPGFEPGFPRRKGGSRAEDRDDGMGPSNQYWKRTTLCTAYNNTIHNNTSHNNTIHNNTIR